MKSFVSLFLFSCIFTFASAQNPYLDSLRLKLNQAKNEDTSRVLALSAMADYYGFIQFKAPFFMPRKHLTFHKN
jgi:hypothetical protein